MDSAAREKYGPLLGLATTVLGLLTALLIFPEAPSPQGALIVPASILALGIAFVPAMRAITYSNTMMNADNFIAVGYVGWLLLDLIQGAYDLSDANDNSLRLALIAVGVSAASMWIGAMGRPWALPQWLLNVARNPLDSRAVERLIPICFFLGMLNYMYSVNFNLVE
ncbi:MAG: hypothetical protein ABI665_20640, partial [Vicinamibacterales bacterium]